MATAIKMYGSDQASTVVMMESRYTYVCMCVCEPTGMRRSDGLEQSSEEAVQWGMIPFPNTKVALLSYFEMLKFP